jgi:hypothetical protein
MAETERIVVELTHDQIHAIVLAMQIRYEQLETNRDEDHALAAKWAESGCDEAAERARQRAEYWGNQRAEIAAIVPALPEWVAMSWTAKFGETPAEVPA